MGDVIAELRISVPGEVFDYQILMDALSDYSKPRDVVTRLLSQGVLVRIKKGLYCFGNAYRRGPVEREYVANLVYGPSYVSLEYALYFYDLIPERVYTVTSVTTKRSKEFDTPLGNFYYRMLSGNRYEAGFTLHSTETSSFLIATPEKALVDKVWTDSRFDGTRISGFEQYLTEDLRIDRGALLKLDRDSMMDICEAYDSAKIRNLATYLEKIWSKNHA